MKNLIHKKVGRKKLFGFLFIILVTFGLIYLYGDTSTAADTPIWIDINGSQVDPNVEVPMKTANMQLNLKTSGVSYNDPTKYTVKWTIESPKEKGIIADINTSTTNQMIGLVSALSPGVATVTVTVIDATSSNLGILASTTCMIRVIFSIDTTKDNSIYKYVYSGDTDRSLVLYSDSTPVPLSLNFGDASNTQWTVANDEIAGVEQYAGILTPKGAGHTKITATYTPAASTTTTYESDLDVYIIPRINTDGLNTYNNSMSTSLPSGGYIYTDAYFGSNNVETIKEKMTWVIKKDDALGNRVVIADSLSKSSDLISLNALDSKSSTLKVDAKAGTYYLEFYPVGTYKSETNKSTITPTVMTLTVFANFGDDSMTLRVGDALNLPDAFNLTKDDFLSYFNVPNITANGMDASNYESYDAATGTITTKSEGKISVSLTASNTTAVTKLFNTKNGTVPVKTSFTITINIINTMSLNQTSVTVTVGQTYQLNAITDITGGTLTWATTDNKYVTVSDTGLITGIKETTTDILVTASLALPNGKIYKATCTVKVEPTITKATINPTSIKLSMDANSKTATLTAMFTGNVTVAPFIWKSTDEKVVTVKAASDNKTAVITAVGGGDAVILLFNQDNSELATCKVRVSVPITSLTVSQTTINDKLITGERSLAKLVTYAPTTANEKELVWKSSDSTVVTVNEEGLASYKGVGTANITVSPKYNSGGIYETIYMTIEASATKINLNDTAFTLENGNTKQMTYTLEPTDCSTTVSWVSDNIEVAEVSSTGLVTAKGPGTAHINAISDDEPAKVFSSAKVTVTQKATDIAFSPTEITIPTGGTYQSVVTLKPVNTTDAVLYKSLDSAIASVDANTGLVKGVKAGSTNILAWTANTGGAAVLTVYVRDSVKGLSLSSSEKTITKGDTFTLSPVFTPANPYNQAMKWTTSNSSIASISAKGSDCEITGAGGGIAIIKGTTEDGGYQAVCMVTVTEKSNAVELDKTEYYLAVGKTVQLNAIVKSEKATNKNVKWSTSNKKVATVTTTGKVKGKKIGKTYIKAKSKDGSGAYATCTIHVVKKVSSLKLNKKSATVVVGNTLTLKATVRPLNATVKKLQWTSSDNSIATVDKSGTIQALAAGLVKIKASTTDGSNKSAICLVQVIDKVDATGVTVTNSTVTVVIGRSIDSGLTIQPNNSTEKLTYKTDDSNVATVNKYGRIFGKSIGQTAVYGTTENGMVGTVEVNVVGMNRTSSTLRQYDTETIWVNGISTNVKWYSENPLIATVVNGKIVARKVGTTTVYAVINGTKVSCQVKVKRID